MSFSRAFIVIERNKISCLSKFTANGTNLFGRLTLLEICNDEDFVRFALKAATYH